MNRYTGSASRLRRDVRAGERARRFRGRLLGAVDQLHVGAKHVAQQRLEQRIVRAPEHERVDLRVEHRLEILARDETRRLVIGPSFLDERNEQRTGARRDAHVGIERANRSLVRARLDRAHGADHADVPAARRGDRGARARLDDADHRHVHLLAQHGERVRRGRVARDDDALHALVAQEAGDLAAVPANGVGTLRTVRHARRVAEVDDALVRELANDFVRDRQSADARIEHADRRGIRHHHLNAAVTSGAIRPIRGSIAKTQSRRDVPQVRGDERVGAGEEVIRDEQRDPVLDVRRARVDIADR